LWKKKYFTFNKIFPPVENLHHQHLKDKLNQIGLNQIKNLKEIKDYNEGKTSEDNKEEDKENKDLEKLKLIDSKEKLKDRENNKLNKKALQVKQYFGIEYSNILVEGKNVQKVEIFEEGKYRVAIVTFSPFKEESETTMLNKNSELFVTYSYFINFINDGISQFQDTNNIHIINNFFPLVNFSLLSKETELLNVSLRLNLLLDKKNNFNSVLKNHINNKMVIGYKDFLGDLIVLKISQFEHKEKKENEELFSLEFNDVIIDNKLYERFYVVQKPNRLYHNQLEKFAFKEFHYFYFIIISLYIFFVAGFSYFLFYNNNISVPNVKEKFSI